MTSRDAWGLAAAVGIVAVAVGCNAQKAAWQAGIPGINTTMTVESVVARDFVLQARVAGDGFGIDTFVPADEVCGRILVPGQVVTYLPNTPRGRFRVGEESCDAVGIGSLRAWRDRRARTGSLNTDPVPRGQANYSVIFRDAEVVFLRGFFPLAARLGWTGGQDTIAVVEDSEICASPVERGVASIEFRPRGPNPLALVSTNGLCPIVGLIQPPAQGRAVDEEPASD